MIVINRERERWRNTDRQTCKEKKKEAILSAIKELGHLVISRDVATRKVTTWSDQYDYS